MAKQCDIQYIRFYTEGSAARKLAPAPVLVSEKPRKSRKKRIVIHLDPVAFCGILVAAVMMISMVVGVVELSQAREKRAQLERYVARLSEENITLQNTYTSGYDLETIEKTALSLGMVRAEDASHISLDLPQQNEPVHEEGFMGRVVAFLTDIFA